jgi:hypothetical protein
MRTTLDIDEDVLTGAKEIAKRESKTAGQVVSELLRRAMTQPPTAPTSGKPARAVKGFRPFPSRGGVVTHELVNRLRDDLEY